MNPIKKLFAPKVGAVGGAAAKVEQPEAISIPTQNDPQVKAASRQRSREEDRKRKGRASTNFGQGGPTYSRKALG